MGRGLHPPKGNFEVILNKKPHIPGSSNRNLQRFSTARGLEAARAAGCDYVLKWRTDMLPTNLSTKQLLNWAQFLPPSNAKSRIVLPAFRNLSVSPDTFSSMPDLFAFGHIDEMEKLWSDRDFDYSQNWNIPLRNVNTISPALFQSKRFTDVYCAEVELYNIYSTRINQGLKEKLTHKSIAEEYLYLIDYLELGILWFGPNFGFRSIGQAWEHPWWTVREWKKQSAKIYPADHHYVGLLGSIRRKISKYKIKSELTRQEGLWKSMTSRNTLEL